MICYPNKGKITLIISRNHIPAISIRLNQAQKAFDFQVKSVALSEYSWCIWQIVNIVTEVNVIGDRNNTMEKIQRPSSPDFQPLGQLPEG